MNSKVYDSPLGRILLTSTDGCAISSLLFVPDVDEVEENSSDVLDKAAVWLDRYFAGVDPGPTPPLAPDGTEFQRRVWQELCRIGYGQTLTYGQLARRVGCGCARAIGVALGRNPILLMIPCHRILAANGIGGFAAGVKRKAALLQLERSSMRLV